MTIIDPNAAILSFASTAWLAVGDLEEAATNVNLLAAIPWRVRSRIRTVEGQLSNIREAIIEMVDGVGTDESEAWLANLV